MNIAEQVATAGQPGPVSRQVALLAYQHRQRLGFRPSALRIDEAERDELLREQCLPADARVVMGLAIEPGVAGRMLVTA